MAAREIDPLLTAILRLTTVHMESAQKPDGVQRHYARHAPLLRQLREAIGGNVKGGGAGGKAANERIPVDPDALDKYLALVVSIHSFFTLYTGDRAPVEELPEVTLSKAFAAYKLAVEHGDVSPAFQRKTLTWWQAQCGLVEEKLSPATRLELVHFPCPSCGCDWAYDVVNTFPMEKDRSKVRPDVDQVVAIAVMYRPGDGLGYSKSYVVCAACEEVWAGDLGIRYIAHEFDNWERTRNPEHIEGELLSVIDTAPDAAA